jgi:hypothetical protein
MIDISLYRNRIGRFSQKILKIKLPKYEVQSPKTRLRFEVGALLKWVKFLVIVSTIFCSINSSAENNFGACAQAKPCSSLSFVPDCWKNCNPRFDNYVGLTGNFKWKWKNIIQGGQSLSP